MSSNNPYALQLGMVDNSHEVSQSCGYMLLGWVHPNGHCDKHGAQATTIGYIQEEIHKECFPKFDLNLICGNLNIINELM